MTQLRVWVAQQFEPATVKQRTLVALLAMPPVLLALWWGGIWWVLTVLLVATIGGLEFYGLMRLGGFTPNRLLGPLWLILLVLSHWPPTYLPLSFLLTTGFIATLIHALFRTKEPLTNWALTCAGAVYIGIMMGQVLALRLLPAGEWWLLLALFIPWTNDTFAYLVGVNIGRHKIWPRLSPKKSWEGTIAGWLGATLISVLLSLATPLPIGPITSALIGLGGGVLALYGDLSISMLKRQVGAKDTGILMPGHGGVLDRLDSVLFVIPFVYQVALLIVKP